MFDFKKFRRVFKLYLNEVYTHPNKISYTPNEVLSIYNNSMFRNPINDTIQTWENAGKPKKLRIKYQKYESSIRN